jgi:hypothetical protein
MDLKTKTYRLLCEGFSQRKIAIISGMTRQRVSQITIELVKEKYIYAPNPRSRPRLYKPTDTPLPLQTMSGSQIRGGRQDDSTEICRAHSLSFVLPLERPFKNPINWIKVWKNNGTTYKQISHLFDIGNITIRLIEGKEKSQVVFFLPEKYLTKTELDRYDRVMWRYIDRVTNWFQKKYACGLGIPDIYQKPEFAIPEDPETLFIGNRYNLKTENSWVDCSEGTSEWETNDIEIAKAKIGAGERILSLEKKVDHIEKMLMSLDEKIVSIDNKFASLESKLDRLNDLLSRPLSPPDPEWRGYS